METSSLNQGSYCIAFERITKGAAFRFTLPDGPTNNSP